MRELIIERIKSDGWMDYVYRRGDYKARDFADYKSWLESLPDEELLDTYNRVRDYESRLD